MPEWFLVVLVQIVLPWTLVAGAVIGLLSITPLGRALLEHLTARRRETELLEMVLDELSALRPAVAEMLERLDATERRIATERQLPLGHSQALPEIEEQGVPHNTPH